jgi:hypothetical protein
MLFVIGFDVFQIALAASAIAFPDRVGPTPTPKIAWLRARRGASQILLRVDRYGSKAAIECTEQRDQMLQMIAASTSAIRALQALVSW